MDAFKLISLTAGFISIIIAAFASIYPSEKYSKQIKIIFSLIFVLSIVTPFVNGEVNISESFDFVDASADVLYEKNIAANEYLKSSVENNISSTIGSYLKENEISFDEIKTSINISDYGSISINEIEIAVDDTAQGDEIIALVRNKTGENTDIKIKESINNETE